MNYIVNYIVKTEFPSKEKGLKITNAPNFITDREILQYLNAQIADHEKVPVKHIRITQWK